MATKPNNYLPVTVDEKTIEALDTIAANKNLTVGSQFSRAFAVANAVGQLRALLTPEVMRPIMALQGTPLGFMTDQKYDENIVREALIEAVLSGVRPVGNEFNIIAQRCYITKAGMKHKLHDIAGLSFSVTCGLPKMSENGAALIVGVDWTYGGKTEHKDLPIPVRVNRGMGADAINGKATRKAYAWLFEHITGQNVNEAEAGEDAPYIDTTAKESSLESDPHIEEVKTSTEEVRHAPLADGNKPEPATESPLESGDLAF